jgi:hypothetical protein
VYGNGDTITVVFSGNTNQVAVATKGNLDALFSFSQVLGANYTGTWTTATTLVITVVDATGATPPGIGGLTLTLQGGSGLKNAANTSLESVGTSGAITGDWGVSDLIAPTITTAAVEANNVYVDIQFSEDVYNTAGGSGALQASDFTITFIQNGGSATGASVAGVTKTSGGALTGGETAVRVNLTITGTPNGVETIEITPVDGSSIYDQAGNAMGAAQTTGVLALNAFATPLAEGKVIIRNNIVNPKAGTHTTIDFRLTKAEKVTITLYDLAGRPVKVLYNRTGNVGLNEVTWDGKNKDGKTVVPGVYYVVVMIGKDRYVHKVLVVR